MRVKLKHFATKIQEFIITIMTSVSFLMIAVSLGYIIYHLICFDFYKVVASCLVLYLMIHLNKSL